MTLNKRQEQLLQDLETFILSDDRCFVVTGPAGAGKTFCIKQLMQKIPAINNKAGSDNTIIDSISACALTNKAKNVIEDSLIDIEGLYNVKLSGVGTIHNILGVRFNYKTGKSNWALVTKENNRNSMYHTSKHGALLIVDEASMLNDEMIKCILSDRSFKKIIFMLDNCQLPPVEGEQYTDSKGNPLMPILVQANKKSWEVFNLTEILRQQAGSGLAKYLAYIRKSLTDNEPLSTNLLVPFDGVYLNEDENFLRMIDEFTEDDVLNLAILTYTNKAKNKWDKMIKKHNPQLGHIEVGDTVFSKDGNKTVVSDIYTRKLLGPAKEELIYKVTETYNDKMSIEIISPSKTIIKSNSWLSSAVEGLEQRTQGEAFSKYICTTVHKAQGSTYTNTFLDVADMNKHYYLLGSNMYLRLLYVGASRCTNCFITNEGYVENVFEE